jgi:hypothetical protein
VPEFTDSDVLTLTESSTQLDYADTVNTASLTEEGGFGGEDGATLSETQSGTATVTATAETGTLADAGTVTAPYTDGETGTLAESTALAEQTTTPTDTDALTLVASSSQLDYADTADGGTLAESGTAVPIEFLTATDALTLADPDGSILDQPTEAITLSEDDYEIAVNDLVAEGILTESAAIAVESSDTLSIADAGQIDAQSALELTDSDPLTLTEAVALVVSLVDTEALAQADGVVVIGVGTQTFQDPELPVSATPEVIEIDSLTVTDAGALNELYTALDAGTLGESAVVEIGGSILLVVVTDSDTLALTDAATAVLGLTGHAHGTAILVARLDGTATLTPKMSGTASGGLD